jgi:hypothetical protein
MSYGLDHSSYSRGVDMSRGAAVVTMNLLPEKASIPHRTRQVNRKPLRITRKSDWTYYAHFNTCTRVYRDLGKKLISAFTPTPTLRTSLQYFVTSTLVTLSLFIRIHVGNMNQKHTYKYANQESSMATTTAGLLLRYT